jgi:hypothetical protein
MQHELELGRVFFFRMVTGRHFCVSICVQW